MAYNPSIAMLEVVAAGLGKLVNDVVFVGGTTTGFYVTDTAAPTVRATDDVDCAVAIHPFGTYRHLEERLEALGFQHDTSAGAPLCRWIYKTITVDVIPDGASNYGFSNPWYEEGLRNAITVGLPSGTTIRILSTPYYLATKFAAFDDRGGGDPFFSHDFEDIITVLDGCLSIQAELPPSGTKVGNYLKDRFHTHVMDEEVIEANISGSPKGRRVQRIQSILADVYGLSF